MLPASLYALLKLSKTTSSQIFLWLRNAVPKLYEDAYLS